MSDEATLHEIKSRFEAELTLANDMDALEAVRVKMLGKSGSLTSLLKSLSQMTPEERKEKGENLNRLKDDVQSQLEAKRQRLSRAEIEEKLKSESVDITLSERPRAQGRVHPLSQTIEEVIAIFMNLGFGVAEGPEIEDDWHNFEALNMPADHPARQMQDTFYMPERAGQKMVLRTHTSNVQIRYMKDHKPPIRIISPGRVYRCDSDQTHTPMFHQVEALVIDEGTHFGHLKGCIQQFCSSFFGIDNLPIRMRPSYFPFTEPSAEVDIACRFEKGQVVIGEGDRWLEIGGSGMVHPKVLENCGIDSTTYQGFAFGFGLERMAMLKYGIPDLRTFFEGDVRWLSHYGFKPHETAGGVS